MYVFSLFTRFLFLQKQIYGNFIFQVVLIAAKGGNKESYVAIDQFQFLEIGKGCELFPPEAQPPTTPTTTEYVPTEPPNRK